MKTYFVTSCRAFKGSIITPTTLESSSLVLKHSLLKSSIEILLYLKIYKILTKAIKYNIDLTTKASIRSTMSTSNILR